VDDISKIFKNKTVAIVGPADSVLHQENGSYIDQFDLIVRFNKGYLNVENNQLQKSIGTRTDVLFHNLRERKEKGEKFDINILQNQSLKYLIGYVRDLNVHGKSNVYANKVLIDFFDNHIKQFGYLFKLIKVDAYRRIFKFLGGVKPTVGFIALHQICNSQAKLVYVTGFTFFQTEYIDGYRDYVDIEDQKKRFSSSKGGHRPNAEFHAFIKLYKQSRTKIELDHFLSQKLNEVEHSHHNITK